MSKVITITSVMLELDGQFLIFDQHHSLVPIFLLGVVGIPTGFHCVALGALELCVVQLALSSEMNLSLPPTHWG